MGFEHMTNAQSQPSNGGWRNAAPIYAAVLAPLTLALVFAAILVTGAWRDAANNHHHEDLTKTATQASTLAHELQKERGMSAGFISSHGAQFGPELEAQRRATDDALARYAEDILAGDAAAVGPENPTDDNARYAAERRERLAQGLATLAGQRRAIDAQRITVPELASFYTGVIVDLISFSDDPLRLGLTGQVATLDMMYGAVLMAKEYAGRERAVGAAGFGAGGFTLDGFIAFNGLQARQQLLFDQVLRHADPALKAAVETAFASPAARRIEALRALAEETLAGGDLGEIDGPAWFVASTAWLAEIKQIEAILAAEILRLSGEKAAQAELYAALEAAAAFGVLLLCGFLGARHVGGMIRAMRGLRDAIVRIAAREADVAVPGAKRRDELGEIARALTEICGQGAMMARIEAGVDVAGAAILVTDADNKLLYANNAFEKLWSADAALARLAATDASGARDMTALFTLLAQAAKGGGERPKAAGAKAVEVRVGG